VLQLENRRKTGQLTITNQNAREPLSVNGEIYSVCDKRYYLICTEFGSAVRG